MLRTIRHAGLAVALGVLAIGVGACGDDDDYENELRPPAPIVVTAAVTETGVSASPSEFGAGPITLIITNQTDSSQVVTIESAEPGSSGISQSSGPINPGDTATLKVDVDEGDYVVRTEGAIDEATLDVGDPRPSAQDELLLP